MPFSSLVVMTTMSAGRTYKAAAQVTWLEEDDARAHSNLFTVDFNDVSDLHILPHDRREVLVVEDGSLLLIHQVIVSVPFLGKGRESASE